MAIIIGDAESANLIYVSSSTGNDANDGLSPLTAKATLAAGKALVRQGYPDHLLLKRGDTWTEALGAWATSGARASLPQVVSAYGSGARPKIRSGVSHGVSISQQVNFVVFRGLHFEGHTYTGANGTPSGIAWKWGSNGLTVEDCYIENYKIGIELNTLSQLRSITKFSIKRNVIVDCYGTGGAKGYGIYGFCIINGDITENLIDEIGTVAPSPGQHGIYIPGNNTVSTYSYGFRVTKNIITNCADCGIKAGAGNFDLGYNVGQAHYDDNLIARCSVGVWLGDQGGSSSNGTFSDMRYNCILEVLDNDGSNARGWGLVLEDCNHFGSLYNVLSNPGAGTDLHPVIIHPLYPTSINGNGVRNAAFDRFYIHGWDGSFLVKGLSANQFGNRISSSYLDFQGFSVACVEHVPDNTVPFNTWRSAVSHYLSAAASNAQFLVNAVGKTLAEWMALMLDSSSDAVIPTWPDATRTIGSYNGSLGGTATTAAFVAEARLQSASNWRPEYTAVAVGAYIRAGFGL